MMRKAIILALGIAATAAHAGEFPRPKVGDWGVVMEPLGGFVAPLDASCRSYGDLFNYYQLPKSEAKESKCQHLKQGTEVLIEKELQDGFVHCVRPRDEKECLWTLASIGSKAEYEDYEKARAEAKKTMEETDKRFDRAHPECEGWRTKEGLPDYCYE